MATPGKCSEWTRKRCKHYRSRCKANSTCSECIEEERFEPNAFYFLDKERNQNEYNDGRRK